MEINPDKRFHEMKFPYIYVSERDPEYDEAVGDLLKGAGVGPAVQSDVLANSGWWRMPQGQASIEGVDEEEVLRYAKTLHHNTRVALERRTVQKWGWLGTVTLSTGVAGFFWGIFSGTILWPLPVIGVTPYIFIATQKWYQSAKGIDLLKKQAKLLEETFPTLLS